MKAQVRAENNDIFYILLMFIHIYFSSTNLIKKTTYFFHFRGET